MDSTTRRIPPSEWDLWKTTILDLAADKTIKNVVSIMEDDYGFRATHSQYETQLDVWENRKNLKRSEWVKILDIFDKLDQRHEECKILISGHPVPTSRIHRARRYCKAKVRAAKRQTRKGPSIAFRNVSIETLGSDGRRTVYANLDDVRVTEHFQKRTSSLLNSIAVDGDLFGNTGPAADSVMMIDRQVDVQVEPLGMNITLLHPNISQISDAQVPDPHVVDDGLWNSGAFDFGPSSWTVTDWTQFLNQISFPAPIFAHSMLGDLPFERFKKGLEAQGVQLTNLSLNSSGVQQLILTTRNPVKLFLTDIFCLSEEDEPLTDRLPSDAMSLLLSLRNLLSNQGFQGVNHRTLDLITEDEIFLTKFNQILLFSIANGFAGLQDIPVERVLKYLSRYTSLNSLLLRLLQTNRSHVAKALTENLFPAAIEAGSEAVLKGLLTICSIDVDNTYCIVDGKKYTPLERAATLQHLGVVKLFLSTGADVNKTFASDPSNGGALTYLISGIRRNAVNAPISEIVELGTLLLQAGAEVGFQVVTEIFQKLSHFHCDELAYNLVTRVPDTDHRGLIHSGLLYGLADQLDDRQATDATRKIIAACDRTECGRCLTEYKIKVEWACIAGAKRGHLQLVQLLSRHSKCLHKVLSAAIRGGNREVINVTLSLGADIDAPAHNIDRETEDRYRNSDESLTTSLAEALEAGDERLVHTIEVAGFLNHLGEGGRFRTAIAAASKTGNIVYVRKLLECCSSPKPSDMGKAVLYALKNDSEEIFWILLAAGADVNFDGGPEEPTPLLAAMLRRNHRMVRGILNADITDINNIIFNPVRNFKYQGEVVSPFGEAVKWGNKSVLQDLRFSFPNYLLNGVELSEVLAQGNAVWFEFLLNSGIASQSALTYCLDFGLRRGDSDLIHNLVKRGADPTEDRLLKKCTIEYPERLPLLLNHIRSHRGSCIVPRFGTDALNAAIRSGRKGFDTAKILLDSGLIDAKSFASENFVLKKQTPLGVAIEWSSKSYPADFTVIEKLLDAGCDPNSVVTISDSGEATYGNQTALLDAIQTGNKDLVQLLITRGADVRAEATLTVKRAPIQKAVEVDSLEIVTLLLELGADVNSKPATRGGATAFQMAAIRGNCNIAAKLFESGADPNTPPSQINGRWPLEGAAENGRLDMIEFLWKMNCGSFPQEQSRKAMELAEGNGYIACRDLIAELSLTGVSSLPDLRLGQWPSFETGLGLM